MENHDPLQPDPRHLTPLHPDPLRDGKNPDRAAGLVTYYMLQRMWEESQEDQRRHWEEESDSFDESAASIPPPVAPSGICVSERSFQRFLWIMAAILLFILFLILVL